MGFMVLVTTVGCDFCLRLLWCIKFGVLLMLIMCHDLGARLRGVLVNGHHRRVCKIVYLLLTCCGNDRNPVFC